MIVRRPTAGETLRQVINKLAFDKALFGNAFLEIVTNRKCSFVSFYHQDATKCRLSKDKSHITLCHNWREYTPMQAPTLPLYPQFDEAGRYAALDYPLQRL